MKNNQYKIKGLISTDNIVTSKAILHEEKVLLS